VHKKKDEGNLQFAGDLFQHTLVGNFVVVGCLNFCGDAHEGSSQCFFGRGEQHLVLNLGGIGRPSVEGDLVPPATLMLVVKVVNSPSTLILWEMTEESVVVAVPALLDDDFGVFIVEVIDDVLVLVTELEILVGGDTRLGCGDTRCHG